MRAHGSITAVSWIPSEAITGVAKLPFGAGITSYDPPPPTSIGSGGEWLHESDGFRFANRLSAWIEVDDDGAITAAAYDGGGRLGHTRLSFGKELAVAAVALPDQRTAPTFGRDSVRFRQTCGGRTGVPAPRTVRRPPFVQYHAPIAWSTLDVTIHVDGSVEGALVGASPFPRHWVYDTTGELTAKTGLIDFKTWYKDAFGQHTPWGNLDSPSLVTAIETALERELSAHLMAGDGRPAIRKVARGDVLAEQGAADNSLFVLLDGVIAVEVDGRELAELGPGAILGERASLDGGTRTATLRAVTPCKVAVADVRDLGRDTLVSLATGHRREDHA